MLLRLVTFFVLLGVSYPVQAKTITCPSKQAQASLEAGPIHKMIIGKTDMSSRTGVQPDMGGDYDDNALHYEWNDLNTSPKDMPVVVTCSLGTPLKKEAKITLPMEIKRCLTSQDGFLCRSGTISFSGYVDVIHLRQIGEDGVAHEISPEERVEDKVKILVWKNLGQHKGKGKLVVSCAEASLPNEFQDMDISEDMQECSLMDQRFRCTATPAQHDLFWPAKSIHASDDEKEKALQALRQEKSLAPRVFCPSLVAHVEVEAGKPSQKDPSSGSFPNLIEANSDGGWGADRLPRDKEWNEINIDENSTPVVAHCFPDEVSLHWTDLEVPQNMKRCLYDKHVFMCQAGTLACPGTANAVELIGDLGTGKPFYRIPPDKTDGKKKTWFLEKRFQNQPKTMRIVAHCVGDGYYNLPAFLVITNDMKECSLMNNRFRCTATPEQHDLFWP